MISVKQRVYDETTGTFTYLICDDESKECAIVDSVAEFDSKTGNLTYKSVGRLLNYIQANSLTLKYVLETHIHADHVTAASYINKKTDASLVISKHALAVIEKIKKKLKLESDGGCYDIYVEDGSVLELGNSSITVYETPGHTPTCVSYKFSGFIIVGDLFLHPKIGTGRCDFPGGDPTLLYNSIHKILDFSEDTKILLCHDYLTDDKKNINGQVTIKEQLKSNVHVSGKVELLEFVNMRRARDMELSLPQLIAPALQLNAFGGYYEGDIVLSNECVINKLKTNS